MQQKPLASLLGDEDPARRRPEASGAPQPPTPVRTFAQPPDGGSASQSLPTQPVATDIMRSAAPAQAPAAAPVQTFAQMQAGGQARPNPPQMQSAAPSGTPQPQSGPARQPPFDVRERLQSLLANPSSYGREAVRQEYDSGARRIDDEYAQKEVQTDEEMARRGVYDSSVAAGRLKDLNIGRRSARTELQDRLAQKLADTNSADERAALGLGMQQSGMDREDARFDRQQSAAERNADRSFDLDGRRMESEDRRFAQTFGLSEREFAAGQGRDARDYSYRAGRDTAGDDYRRSRDTTEDSYRRGRDTVGDSRYASEDSYRRGRDTVGDSRYASEDSYRRGRDTSEDDYRRGRDTVGDSRDARNFDEDRRRFDDGSQRDWWNSMGGLDYAEDPPPAPPRDEGGYPPYSDGRGRGGGDYYSPGVGYGPDEYARIAMMRS